MDDNFAKLFEIESLEELELLDKTEILKRVRFLQASNTLLQQDISSMSKQVTEMKSVLGLELQERLFLEQRYLTIRNEFYGASSERRKKDRERTQEELKGKPKPKVQLPSLRYPKLDLAISRLDFEEPPTCSCCQATMSKMNQVESAEYIEVITRKFFVKRQEREKYRCSKCHGDIQTTPAPRRLIEGGSYSSDFAVEVAIGKYADHLPMERQAVQMRRQGLVGIDSNTLIEQSHHLADLMRGVYRSLGEEVKTAEVLYADETSWRMLEGHPKKSWYLWGFFTPYSAFYKPKESRSKEMANEVLSQCKAKYLIVDGYTGYHSPSKEAGITICNCWAHARRKFIQAESAFPEASEMIDLIGELYNTERDIADDEKRREIRNHKSKEIINRIRDWLYQHRALPKSSLGKAISYTEKYWEGLTRFLEHPQIALDNNLSERSLRGPVLGRKNAYGSHSQKGAETSAILYSICESCKLNLIDPHEYLKYAVRTKLAGEAPKTPQLYRIEQMNGTLLH
jgi:transposase